MHRNRIQLLIDSSVNLAGVLVPAILIIPFYGYLARALSPEEFGFFLISYAVLGYASLFDGGLSRAIVRLISVQNKNYPPKEEILGSALVLAITGSLFAACLLTMYSRQIAIVMNFSLNNLENFITCLKILAFAIPPMIANLILLSVIEATQRFKEYNLIKIKTFIVQIGSCLILLSSFGFLGIILGIAIGRYLSLIWTIKLISSEINYGQLKCSKNASKLLISVGGWFTISNVVSPLMVYFDKFVISSTLGAHKVAFYAMPSELVSKINILPVTICRTFFPYLSRINDSSSPEFAKQFRVVTYLLSASMLIGVVSLFLAREWVIEIWLGSEFVVISSEILGILLVGFFFNGLSQLPLLFLQSQGIIRPVAVVHLVEVVPYLSLLYILLQSHGLTGAAFAWSARVTADFILLLILATYAALRSRKTVE